MHDAVAVVEAVATAAGIPGASSGPQTEALSGNPGASSGNQTKASPGGMPSVASWAGSSSLRNSVGAWRPRRISATKARWRSPGEPCKDSMLCSASRLPLDTWPRALSVVGRRPSNPSRIAFLHGVEPRSDQGRPGTCQSMREAFCEKKTALRSQAGTLACSPVSGLLVWCHDA